MNTAYWRTNNVEIIASNGIMRTTFGPEQDVGAKTLRGFIGIAGQIYRAAFVLRFKDAPGFNPTIVEWPYRMLDFNSIEVVNAPYYTKNEVEGEYYSKSEVQSNYYSKSELDVMLEAAGRVQSVNSKTGAVEIAADDVGAYPATKVSSWTGYYYKGNENLVIQKSNNNMLEIQDNMISIAEGIQGSDPKIATYRTDMVFRQRGRNQYQHKFPDKNGTFAMTDDLKLKEIESTNMVISSGLPGTTKINADLSVTETPEPAYNVTTNELPFIPNVITGRTTRASGTRLDYEYEGLINGSHSWKTSLSADKWTDAWYGGSCPSGITYSVSANCWYLHTGNGQHVELSKTDFPPMKVMLGKVALTGSYRMGSSMMQWKAAPMSWTNIKGGEYSEDFPHYETNYYEVVRTKLLRRDEISEWALENQKPSYTPSEIGALPASKYLTTSTWFGGDGVDCFALGSIYKNAGINKDGYLEAVLQGGMASDFVPLVYNSQLNATGVTYKCYRTSFGTNGTFDVNLQWPKENGTFATREWAQEKISESTVGAYPATSGATLEENVSAMGAQMDTIGSTLNAEDAKFEVTNYNSAVHMPEASFSVKIQNETTGSNEWILAWKEMTRWNWFLGMFGAFTNDLNTVLGNKSEKEYAFYDGVTGNPAPDGFFWIGQPRVAICAGMAYQRYADAKGEVWVLESNGMVAEVNGTENGFFRITDSENEVQFEIIKGDKRTLAAAPRTMTSQVMGVTHYFTSYATTNAVSNPVARFRRDLQSGSWIDETNPECPCNTSWTDKGGGIYECEWWPKSTEPRMFMAAVYETGGSTRIVQHAPVEMQKIIIGGVEYTIGTDTINGKTVLTLTATP